jgi:hypothetical protein
MLTVWISISYYPGLNALFLAVIILELAAGYPDVWSAPFADDTSANAKVTEIKRKLEQIAQALQLCFVNADAPVPERVKQDMWLPLRIICTASIP